AHIYIGKGSYIAPNVGIITSNHDLADLESHTEGKDVVIGDKCWIGMNSVILPGVVLGNGTIVAAGAVVTKSFKQGNIVIAGVPAKIIKE
ncbi:DapH/DapD/GlmU-related protein, partial [Acinetobacter baumannii]